MFTKNKVSQSMIDAVKSIINESGTPIKEPTSTGMRVYGRSYGNSAKAKQDQTKKDIDTIKGPKDKEMKEAAKPDYIDLDKDGNKTEPMKQAAKQAKVKSEELKGNQDKIDANHNDKIDAQDFKILRAKKKVTEDMHFAKKLLEAEKAKQSPAKNQDIADKSYLKDKPGVKSDLKNLGRFLTGKKETNEEVEQVEEKVDVIDQQRKDAMTKTMKHMGLNDRQIKYRHKKMDDAGKGSDSKKQNEEMATEEQLDEISKKLAGSYRNAAAKDRKFMGHQQDLAAIKLGQHLASGQPKLASRVKLGYNKVQNRIDKRTAGIKAASSRMKAEEVELSEEQLDEMINEVLGKDATAGDWIHDFVHSDNPKFAGKSKAERKKMALGAYYGAQKEAYDVNSDAPITTDTLAGRMPGGKSNSFKSFKTRVKSLDKEGDGSVKQPECDIPKSNIAKASIKTEGKRPETDDAPPFDEPYTKSVGNVKDKSGAVHTPMSRARDLARAAMKKVKTEMLGKTGTSEGKKW